MFDISHRDLSEFKQEALLSQRQKDLRKECDRQIKEIRTKEAEAIMYAERVRSKRLIGANASEEERLMRYAMIEMKTLTDTHLYWANKYL